MAKYDDVLSCRHVDIARYDEEQEQVPSRAETLRRNTYVVVENEKVREQ